MISLKKVSGKHSGGFTLGEMAALLLVTCVFIAGVVFFVDRGVRSLEIRGSRGDLSSKGDLLTQHIGAILREARQFNISDEQPAAGKNRACSTLDFLADLDGDDGTGLYSEGGVKGLERVVISRSQDGKKIIAEVYSKPGISPSVIEITNLLEAKMRNAFLFEYLPGCERGKCDGRKTGSLDCLQDLRVEKIRVSIALSSKGKTLRVARSLPLKYAPVKNKVD